MTEEEFAQRMQSFIDQRDAQIAALKALIDERKVYLRGLENDYSRIGLELRKLRDDNEELRRRLELVEKRIVNPRATP